MELVVPMYNAHPDFSLKNLGKEVYIIHSEIWYVSFFKIFIVILC